MQKSNLNSLHKRFSNVKTIIAVSRVIEMSVYPKHNTEWIQSDSFSSAFLMTQTSCKGGNYLQVW